MGKMNRSTYQRNAYTSEWGGGHVGVRESKGTRGRFCLRFGGRRGGGSGGGGGELTTSEQ